MRLAGIAVVLGALGAVIGQGPAVGSAMAAGKQISVPKVVETRRFVVTFKIPVDSTPESDRIRTAQNRLIADLSRFPVKVIRRPASVPQVVIAIDAAGLAALEKHPNVVSVEPDEIVAPAPGSSTAPVNPSVK